MAIPQFVFFAAKMFLKVLKLGSQTFLEAQIEKPDKRKER